MSSEFSRFSARLRPRHKQSWGRHVDEYDPDAVQSALGHLAKVFGPDKLYPVEQRGAESVPEPPCLLVSNHSGGVLVPDAFGLGFTWYSHFGTSRPLHGLIHEVPMQIKRLGEPLAKLGGITADREAGRRVLADVGRDLLVMPGGDLDVYRPYRDRYRVQFGGRRGYAKLALAAGVPIVPVANSGAHATFMVLSDGQRIARALKLRKYFRAGIFPISLTAPWGLTIGPWPHVPIPTRFRYRFGPPVTLPETFKTRVGADGKPTSEAVEELDRRVRDSMQELLDGLETETPGMRQRLRNGLRT